MARRSLMSYNQHKNRSNCPYKRHYYDYHYLWQQSPLTPYSCFTSKVTRFCLIGKTSTVNFSSAGAPKFSGTFQNNMGITAHQSNSFIYGHIFVMKLHSFCATQIGTLLCWFVTYFIHISLFFLITPFKTVICIMFVYETRRLGFHIYYFSVYFYHHQFHFHAHSTAPFYSTVLSGCSFPFAYIYC